MFIVTGFFGISSPRGFNKLGVDNITISFQNLYDHVQNNKGAPSEAGALGVSSEPLTTGNPITKRQNQRILNDRLENSRVESEVTGREKNVSIVENVRKNALVKVVQEQLARQISELYAGIFVDAQAGIKQIEESFNENSQQEDIALAQDSQSSKSDVVLDGARANQVIAKKSQRGDSSFHEGHSQSKVDKNLLEVPLNADEGLAALEVDPSINQQVAGVDLGEKALELSLDFVRGLKQGAKAIVASGDPLENAKQIDFSTKDIEAFRDLLRNQVLELVNQGNRPENVSEKQFQDFRNALDDTLRRSVKRIPDEQIKEALGLVSLEREVNENSQVPVLPLIPQLSLLSITKRVGEAQIGQLLNDLESRGNERISTTEEVNIKSFFVDVVTQGLPRKNEIQDFVLSTFESVRKGSQDDAVTAKSLKQEIKDTLDQVIKFLQIPEPLARQVFVDSRDEDSPLIIDLGENDPIGKDKKQKDAIVDLLQDKRLEKGLSPLLKALGLDHPDLLALAKVLRPHMNEHIQVQIGEVSPNVSYSKDAESTSKTKGPIPHLFHEGLTDSSLIFSAYWSYQVMKVKATDRLSEQVPLIHGKEDRPRSENPDFEDTENNISIVRDVQHSVDTDPVLQSKRDHHLPPVYERPSAELEERFKEAPPEGEKKRRPNPQTPFSTDTDIWS